MKPLAATAMATLTLVSVACSADETVASVRADREGAAATGREDDSSDVLIEFDEPPTIEQGVAWDELLPTLPAEISDVFPDSDAFNPTWWFDTTTTVDSETGELSDDCPAEVAHAPAGMLARFQLARPFDPALYREGVLEITVLHDNDASLVADHAAARVESVDCLADRLSDDVSLQRIDDGLPDHATVAYNLTWESIDDPTEPSIGFTLIQLHHEDVFAQVMMNSIQPTEHPEWIDVEREAMRIAHTLDLDG